MRRQRIHNAQTNVLPLSIDIENYVMIRMHSKRDPKLQSKWRGPMRVVEANYNLVLVVEDILNARKTTVHAQHMQPYPVTHRGEQASAELKQQAEHYDTTHHLVGSIRSIWKKGGKHEVIVG